MQQSYMQRMIKHTCYFNTPLAEAPVLRRKQARRNQLDARPAIKAAGLLFGSYDTAMQSKLMQSLPNYFAAKKRNGREQKQKKVVDYKSVAIHQADLGLWRGY